MLQYKKEHGINTDVQTAYEMIVKLMPFLLDEQILKKSSDSMTMNVWITYLAKNKQ